MKELNKIIKRCREGKGFGRQYMADMLGLTINGYGKIERGEVDITMSRMFEIARIFQMPMGHFFEDLKPPIETTS